MVLYKTLQPGSPSDICMSCMDLYDLSNDDLASFSPLHWRDLQTKMRRGKGHDEGIPRRPKKGSCGEEERREEPRRLPLSAAGNARGKEGTEK